MKNLIFLTALLLPLLAGAQGASKYARTNSDTVPERFQLNASHLREHLFNGISPALQKELGSRSCFRFADQSAVQMAYLLSSGQVYSDWALFEEYLNRVVQKIMPPELAQDSVIHAYLLKNGAFNAFMTPSGILFVHIGLFDEVPTEAALAGVLAHELAHYFLRHSLNRYVKSERGEFERVFNKSSSSKFSIQNELQADSLAIVWMDRSGYGIQGFAAGMKAIQDLENRRLLQMETVWELKETTHPVSGRRLAQVDSFARSHAGRPNTDFVVSKKLFFTFREHAKLETLKYLLYDFAYNACIEKAFKFHILNPNKPEYVYYIMEGIRRKCYFNVDFWKKKFIIDPYYKVVEGPAGRKKVKLEGNLFKEKPEFLFSLTPEELQILPGRFYWEGPEKFETYEEAFTFFSQIGELFQEPEFLLSNALSFNSTPQVRDSLLTRYLASPKAQYRDYATALLKGTVQTGLPNKTLCVLSDFFATVRQGQEEIFIRNENLLDNSNFLIPLLETAIAQLPGRQFVSLAELQKKSINDYILLLELKKLSLLRFVAKGEKTELHVLDPRYWEIMHKYQVNEMEFIDFIYYDSRKAETSMEAYQEVMKRDLKNLLSETKRNRYLESRISAIRMRPFANMKILHFEPEVKVDFNQPATEKVVTYIQEALKSKDKTAKRMDTTE